MSSLLLLNGSPRGPRSNSMKMLSRVEEGWRSAGPANDQAVELLHLAHRADFDRAVGQFGRVETVVLGMPLYTDAMPALAKTYIEALAQYAGRAGNPRLGFLVQSGFSEALHSRPLERYLEKLARRMGCEYAGTIIRGGGEALQMMPEDANKKLWTDLRMLGSSLAVEGHFDPALLAKVARTERYSTAKTALLKAALRFPIAQFYWNGQLKRNGAWEGRFATPYAERLPTSADGSSIAR
jgi:Flavodoxin-like fold